MTRLASAAWVTGVKSNEIGRRSIERALTAAALRYDGLTFRQIGERLGGITSETARQAVLKGERILATRYAALNECAVMVARGAGFEPAL